MTPVISCSAVSTTPAKNLSPVLLTLVNNIYFPRVIDTVQKKPKNLKFIASVNDTAKKLFTSVKTPLINFLAMSATPAIRESCQY
jgi:hypothetical protein